MRWRPDVYARYATERSRPFFDLTARIDAEAPRRVVDLGCGPGHLTAALRERWPGADVLGLDSSAEMIREAAAAGAGDDRLTFELADVATWMPDADVDVVVSNATLQWIPGHRELVRAWADALPAGAWIAFSVPGNFGAPSHRLLREHAAAPRWRARLDGVLRPADAVAEPADYLADALDAGWRADAWETTYLHVLQGGDPVLQWVRGTALRPVLDVLDAEEAADFEAGYAAALREAYPAGPHGTVLPFRRLFCVAHRA
jgi:trans-aconitate 2-methyltransferase